MASVSRRGFLKGAGALGALVALGSSLGCTQETAEPVVTESDGEKVIEEKIGYCCQCTYRGCAFRATVEDGVLTQIEGVEDRVMNLGSLCPRPNTYPMYQYNPYRIKAPMKRTNPEKGLDIDPGWVEITWDEALDLAAEKLKEVHDRNPLELIHEYGFADRDSTESGFAGINGFAPAFGTKTIDSSKGQFCALHYVSSQSWGTFAAMKPDYYYGKYIMMIGRAAGMTGSIADGTGRGAAYFLKKGGRMICVDPYCSIEGSLGEWQPIKPSTELSFTYAILYSMLFELDNWDKESVKARTDACFLIGSDGEYVRGESGKIQVWDPTANAPKDFDAEGGDLALEGTFDVNGVQASTVLTLFKQRIETFTPEWAEPICTVSAAQIRQYAKDLIEYAEIGNTITIDGVEMPYRPAAVVACRGVTNHDDGTRIDQACRFINLLLGNEYVPGGANVSVGGALSLDDDNIIKPSSEGTPADPAKMNWPPLSFDLLDVFPHRHSTDTLMWQVCAEGPEKYGFEIKPRVLFSASANSVPCTANPETVVEGMKNLEYIIYAFCYHIDETAMMADLLLPSHSRIEGMFVARNVSGNTFSGAEENYLRDSAAIMYRDIVPPLYNTMRGNDITIELADRIGILPELNKNISALTIYGKKISDTEYELDPNVKYTCEEIWDRFLKNQLGEDKGLDYLKEVGIIPQPIESTAAAYRYSVTPEARFTFYQMYQKHSGETIIKRYQEMGIDENYLQYPWQGVINAFDPLPYYPTFERRLHNAPEEYDLWTFTYRMPLFLFRFGGQDQNVWSREWAKAYDPEFGTVLMNPIAAEARHLRTGDTVVLESYNAGTTKAKLFVTERVHPETVGFGGAIGRFTKAMGEDLSNDPNYAALINGHMGQLNFIHGGTEVTTRVKVYRAEEDK